MNKIIEKIKIAAAIILSLVLSLVLSRYIFPQKGKVTPSNLAMKTVLAQSPDMSLTIKELNVEPISSSNYKLDLPQDFYIFKILDAKNNEIYEGKILNKHVIPPPDYFGSDPSQAPKTKGIRVEIPSTLTLYLPYFKDARKIIFVDENGVTKLAISVANLTIPK